MFALSGAQRYWPRDENARGSLYGQVVDMRKSFDGLSGLVSQQMGQDVCSGDVYIFLGKDLTKIKLLVWQTGGFVLYYKRLEAGTFRLPTPAGNSLSLSYSELCLLIEGLDVVVTHRRKRFVPAVIKRADPT